MCKPHAICCNRYRTTVPGWHTSPHRPSATNGRMSLKRANGRVLGTPDRPKLSPTDPPVWPAGRPTFHDRWKGGFVVHGTTASAQPTSTCDEDGDLDLDVNLPGRVFSQIGPWAMVPIWVLDPAKYLPGADPAKLKPGDEKPLSGAELRVFISMRSFADARSGHLNPFVRTLAERAGLAMNTTEKAIAKFKRLGWLVTKRRYRPDGSIYRCDYFLRDTCPAPGEGVPSKWREGYPRDGGNPSLEMEGAKNRPDEHTTRTNQGSDQSSTTTSGRFAPSSGGGAKVPKQRSWDDLDRDQNVADEFVTMTNEPPPRSASENLSDARQRDRELFRTLVGDKIRTDGSVFGAEGTYRWDQFYTAFRKWKRDKPIRWPGKMLERIADDAPTGGVEDWLLNLGLESAT